MKSADEDICKGLENVAVLIEGNVDKHKLPSFQYSPENVPGPGCDIDPSEVNLPGCSCHSHSCQKESCSCLLRYGQPYDGLGRLQDYRANATGDYSAVFECNALCGCSEGCPNRVVQRGLCFRLSVFQTGDRGWGVRTLEPIARGRFVCEYAGEVIATEEARRRQLAQGPRDMNYIIGVREHAGKQMVSETFVDPIAVGNVGRFLNHSCEPNLYMVPVRVHSVLPRLALFAGRDIAPNEELSFDYSGGYNNTAAGGLSLGHCDPASKAGGTEAHERKPCLCGAHNCSRFLPFDFSLYNC